MKAIRINQFGGLDVLNYEDVPVPQPEKGQARVKLEASGVNFIDVYHRDGRYKPPLPVTLGQEGAGVVDAVGPEVTEVKPGDRVAYTSAQGSYAEYAIVPAWRLVPVPPNINSESAAAVLLQGLTAHYLTHSTFPLKSGDTALIHAAAGGLGLLLVQMAKTIGARVIGISVDMPYAQKAWADQHGLSFPLLSDYNREAVKAFGVEDPNFAKGALPGVARRSVFVLDKDGRVTYRWLAEAPGIEPNYSEVEEAAGKAGAGAPA